MKKIMMTLTNGRACSRSTKRTSSFGARLIAAFAAVLCCAMTTTVFTACGGDDDNGNTSPAQSKVVGYQVDYSLVFPKEVDGNKGNVYLLCDKIEVGYIDENGQEKREVVNNGQWTKSVTYKQNLNGYLKLYLTKPASIDTESLTYNLYRCGVTMTPTEFYQGIQEIYSDGTKKVFTIGSANVKQHVLSVDISKNKVAQYVEERLKEEVEILTIELRL